MHDFEECNILPRVWGWIVLFFICAVLIGYGLLAHAVVRDVPRNWDFGQLPDFPSQHPFSTYEPDNRSPIPEQLPPLPSVQTIRRFSGQDTTLHKMR